MCYHQYNSSSIVSVFTTDLSCSAHPLVNFQNRFQRVYLVQKGKQRGAPKINAQAHMTTEFFFVFIASFKKKKPTTRQSGLCLLLETSLFPPFLSVGLLLLSLTFRFGGKGGEISRLLPAPLPQNLPSPTKKNQRSESSSILPPSLPPASKMTWGNGGGRGRPRAYRTFGSVPTRAGGPGGDRAVMQSGF